MESIDVKAIIKEDIPEKQIEQFEDRVVYFTALLTREFTKGARAYPHLTGELERQEVRVPIQRLDKASYGLLRGTTYASYVYKMKNVKWTNPSTQPQWYSTIYRQREKTITETAQERALKELKE
jgi:hypothetical protein